MRAKYLGPKPDHCAIEGCLKPYYAKNWCKMHYERDRRNGDVNYIPVLRREKTCEFEGCNEPQHSMDLCMPHYRKKWRDGEVTPLRKWVRVERTSWGQRCTECFVMKAWDDFYNRADIPNTKQTSCKECWKARNAARHARLRDKQNA